MFGRGKYWYHSKRAIREPSGAHVAFSVQHNEQRETLTTQHECATVTYSVTVIDTVTATVRDGDIRRVRRRGKAGPHPARSSQMWHKPVAAVGGVITRSLPALGKSGRWHW